MDISLMNNSEFLEHKEKLGERIKFLREERGFKVREFALLADIEHHQLINIEKGRVDMRFSTLFKIATALQLSVAELITL